MGPSLLNNGYMYCIIKSEVTCVSKIELLKSWVSESNNIVAFTGAGVSTESGIKDFRSKDGLYAEKWRANKHDSTEICKLDHHNL